MGQAIAGVRLLLSISSLFSSVAGCDQYDPLTCYFNAPVTHPIFCSWSTMGNVSVTEAATSALYCDLRPGNDTASLTSRTACSTGGQMHCLRFDYIYDANNVSQFSVSVKCDVSDEAELVWVTSSSVNLSEGRVPITTDYNYSVIFKAETLFKQNRKHGLVRIGNIRYQNTSCTLEPPAASPTSTAKTTSSNIPSSTTNARVQLTKPAQTSTLSPASGEGEDNHTETSVKLGIIVGVVVGVIVFIIVIVLLLVLLRRKRRHSSKANKPDNSGRRRRETATPTQSSDNCSIMKSPGDPQPSTESEIPVYAVVNKSRKTKQENPPHGPYENCEHDTQNLNQNSELDRAHEQGQDRDVIRSTPRNPDPMIASGSSVYQVPRGDTTTKSEDQGVEYNALDFEGQRSFLDKRTAEGTCEDGAGTVYNHLNDGDEDAYNEVDRHNKALGFSDEYSHIQ